MTPKQRSLIDFNLGRLDISLEEKEIVFRMSREQDSQAYDSSLVSLIWDLGNKRVSEWSPTEKALAMGSLRTLIYSYQKKHPINKVSPDV